MPGPAFAAALLDPGADVPDGLIDPKGRPAPLRFAVYRNNVTVGLTRAVEDGFPAIRRLVGDAFFAAMAREYLRAHPPKSPILTLYGADFADFLTAFPPVAHLGYLPDIARLEYALRQSYHAADMPPANLSRIDPEVLMNSRLIFAPATHLLISDWPILAIWLANTAGGPTPAMSAENVLVTRPGFDPEPQCLPPGGAKAIAALMRQMTLAEALTAAPECDPGALLSLLIQGGTIARIDT